MLKVSLCCAVAAGALLAASAGARAAEPYTFALVPKSTTDVFDKAFPNRHGGALFSN